VRPFVRFGPEHLASLLLPILAAAALSTLMRRDSTGRVARTIRVGLALLFLGGAIAAMWGGVPLETLDWADILPLHLCDLLVLIAVWALLSRRQGAYEVLYYWGLTGTLIATITPDVDTGFPDPGCISFFGLHGGVVTAAILLTAGAGMRPRRGSVGRVFAFTNAYAAFVGVVDWALDRNYLYLREKPSQASILDWFGPWPWYLLAADLLALALFLLLWLPFRNVADRPGAQPNQLAVRESGR
jgi:hypothetical integral membrane protein (TIGR02206 family)